MNFTNKDKYKDEKGHCVHLHKSKRCDAILLECPYCEEEREFKRSNT